MIIYSLFLWPRSMKKIFIFNTWLQPWSFCLLKIVPEHLSSLIWACHHILLFMTRIHSAGELLAILYSSHYKHVVFYIIIIAYVIVVYMWDELLKMSSYDTNEWIRFDSNHLRGTMDYDKQDIMSHIEQPRYKVAPNCIDIFLIMLYCLARHTKEC